MSAYYSRLASDILHDWIIRTVEEADFAEILDEDPDSGDLLDDEYQQVLEQMVHLKVAVNIQ